MNIIDRPIFEPHQCAVLLKGDDPKGFVDTGVELRGVDPRVYVSHGGVKLLAEAYGYRTPDDYAALQAAHDQLAARVEELEGELEDREMVLESIEVLEAHGYRSREPELVGAAAPAAAAPSKPKSAQRKPRAKKE